MSGVTYDDRILIRLADVDPDDLIGFLDDSYRSKATAKELAAFDDAVE